MFIPLIAKYSGSKEAPPDYSWLDNAVLPFDGNSLTAGQGASAGEDYPTKVAALIAALGVTGATKYNFGVGAQQTSAMIADAATQIDTLYTPGVPNILFAWEIGNDIYFNGSVSGAETRWQTYCNARKAAGWKVIVITCTPRNQSTAFGDNITAYNAKLSTANAWLKANYLSFADGIVKPDEDARLNDFTSITYFADGTHYTAAGYNVLANLVLPVLLGLAP